MPVTKIFWGGSKSNVDIHVIAGQTSPDLSESPYLAVKDDSGSNHWARDYLDSNSDTEIFFKPLFKGTESGNTYSGLGISVDTETGEISVTSPMPSPRKFNFILEVEARKSSDDSLIDTEAIRIHVHNSISQIWLTPSELTVRPFTSARPETTHYKFAVRAEFDDGVVGDISGNPALSWSPSASVTNDGEIILTSSDTTGDLVPITVDLPAALGGHSSTANVKVVDAWESPTKVDASIVVGGGWPGIISLEKVPNVLFIGEGFKAEDESRYNQYVNSLVHYLKKNPLNKPYDLLATSINFWSAFYPSPERGISINTEMYPYEEDGDEVKVGFVPPPEKPPDDHTGNWKIRHLIYKVGLPVHEDRRDGPKSNETILNEWKQVLDEDPTDKVDDHLISWWRAYADRTMIDNVDSAFGIKSGAPLMDSSDYKDINFNPNRMNRARLNSFLRLLSSPEGYDLSGLWDETSAESKPNNYDLVCIIVQGNGRALNSDGYFFVDTQDTIKAEKISGKNGLKLKVEPADILTNANNQKGRLLAHELSHSFGLGDEYGEAAGPPTSLETDDIAPYYGNLTLEDDAKRGDDFHGDEIKWAWNRVKKAAYLIEPIEDLGGDKYKLKLDTGQAFQFQVGDTVHLRYREYPKPLIKFPKLSAPLEITNKSNENNEINVQPQTGGSFSYPNIVNPGDFVAEFPAGSAVYIPKPAPESVRTENYPYAELIAKNIKDHITSSKKPLTEFPSKIDNDNVQQPKLDGVDLPFCYKHKPRIVGLYSGGKAYHKGIFHPTGTCIMRDNDNDGREFCAVCRYVLIDIIDPYKHALNDREYEEIYPQK